MNNPYKKEDSKDLVDFEPGLSDEERAFYRKAFPNVDLVNDRAAHCTVCKCHLGTAPSQESGIRMHPVLRVSHCTKCHDFYNSGEFSKGEDGSELYCRWCGQGGEVYCCSNCPFVFCKSCIVKNLSRGVVADIENNENWSCFNCAPKIIWPLRAQHWALVNCIEKQKKEIQSMKLPEVEKRQLMSKDRSTCCRPAKVAKTEPIERVEPAVASRSQGPLLTIKKTQNTNYTPPAKRAKSSNDEVVCTPDLLSMLEPDCEILPVKSQPTQPASNTAAAKSTALTSRIRQDSLQKNSTPPPLVLRNTSVIMRPATPSASVKFAKRMRSNNTPVYHTINGYCIDLNTAAQQEKFRLPNGKLIQVKRQSTQQSTSTENESQNKLPQSVPKTAISPAVSQAKPPMSAPMYGSNTRGTYTSTPNSSTAPYNNGTQTPRYTNASTGSQLNISNSKEAAARRSSMARQQFSSSPIGVVRTKLQNQLFNAMEICQHLEGKVETLANSKAYNQALNYFDAKELYVHLSYLITYAIGRYKGLQDKCLAEMRQLGFVTDADNLENGQLAAGVDYVRYGQLEDVDLFNPNSNSFHNQVYEYRQSLHADLDDSDKDSNRKCLENNSQSTDEMSLMTPMRVKVVDKSKHLVENGLTFKKQTNKKQTNSDVSDTLPNKSMRKYDIHEIKSHAYDSKLASLVEQYPSIWCTRHPDYGNFEVTRRHWRSIGTHFRRGDNLKLRWKNVRKRYVRIERRRGEGKRFNGYFDKSTDFLANRNLEPGDWPKVTEDNAEDIDCQTETEDNEEVPAPAPAPETKKILPLDIYDVDLRIINFVKSNQCLWCRLNIKDENTENQEISKMLWTRLAKTIPNYTCDMIMERWQYLYEMYRTFRFKNIRDDHKLENLELKFSKYLAKLHFLYKIDDDGLQDETYFTEPNKISDVTERFLDRTDDEMFTLELVLAVSNHPPLWDKWHNDYNNAILRNGLWNEIAEQLSDFHHKHTIDDDEIQIVEPVTVTITLDSDNDAEPEESVPPLKLKTAMPVFPPSITVNRISSGTRRVPAPKTAGTNDDVMVDLLENAQTSLAGVLEIDISETATPRNSENKKLVLPKQPRKKTTFKPNPTLIRQKEIHKYDLLDDMKSNDRKLKMKCQVTLRKVDDEYPHVVDMVTRHTAGLLLQNQKRERVPLPEQGSNASIVGSEHEPSPSEKRKRNAGKTTVVACGKQLANNDEQITNGKKQRFEEKCDEKISTAVSCRYENDSYENGGNLAILECRSDHAVKDSMKRHAGVTLTVKNSVDNDADAFEVNEEIQEILQNRNECEKLMNVQMNPEMETGTVPTISPLSTTRDLLFDDINELIEKEKEAIF